MCKKLQVERGGKASICKGGGSSWGQLPPTCPSVATCMLHLVLLSIVIVTLPC